MANKQIQNSQCIKSTETVKQAKSEEVKHEKKMTTNFKGKNPFLSHSNL